MTSSFPSYAPQRRYAYIVSDAPTVQGRIIHASDKADAEHLAEHLFGRNPYRRVLRAPSYDWRP